MRYIKKASEPRSLKTYRRQPQASYAGLMDGNDMVAIKNELRQCLMIEQGHLCCYCMTPLRWDHDTKKGVKIEHFHCQNGDKENDLNYRNLFAACPGIKGRGRKNTHCDTRKGDRPLSQALNPTNQRMERVIRFARGTIKTGNEQLDQEIENVLNLNHITLVDDRKSALKGVYRELDKRKGKRLVRFINHQLEIWEKPDSKGRFQRYCGVVIYALKKRLRLENEG